MALQTQIHPLRLIKKDPQQNHWGIQQVNGVEWYACQQGLDEPNTKVIGLVTHHPGQGTPHNIHNWWSPNGQNIHNITHLQHDNHLYQIEAIRSITAHTNYNDKPPTNYPERTIVITTLPERTPWTHG
jgi:hypothetical protein